MVSKGTFGFIAGLGAILGLLLGIIFLNALLIVQPLEIAMLPRRMWMHNVTFEWVLVSFGLCALCSLSIWLRIQSFATAAPPRRGAVDDANAVPEGSHVEPEAQPSVWVCSLNTSPVSRHLAAEGATPDYLDVVKRYQSGEETNDAEVPRAYMLQGRPVPKDIMINDFLFVSDQIAELLREFDLGQDKLISIDGIYTGRDRTKLENDYAILTLVNRKAAFCPQDCVPSAIWQFAKGVPLWGLYADDFPDNSFAVTEDGLDGPDIWKDPATPQQLYVSERLKAALDAQGIGKEMGFKRCRVVS